MPSLSISKNHRPKATILVTIDVEDWFQVENFRAFFPATTWSQQELRVERNVNRLLELFASMSSNGSPLKATFFILGWIAERLPHLVREIQSQGHEVASHGADHIMCHELSDNQLAEDLSRSKKCIEDIVSCSVIGYRAPSFSINERVIDQLRRTGYRYDSSYNSFSLNSRYGELRLKGHPNWGTAYLVRDGFFEIPLSNLEIFGRTLPMSGGGYFRLYPNFILYQGVRHILAQRNAYVFYLHPWEIDPGQPRVTSAGRLTKFRHYFNLESSFGKLRRLLKVFSDHPFNTCSEYVAQATQNT